MKPRRYLEHDVLLLCSKWSNPEHFPADPAITGWAWRNYYERALEKTIAEWFERSLLAWQFDTRSAAAFAPIAHLIGTARSDVDYIESLAAICTEMEHECDRNYQSSPDPGGPSAGGAMLGVCMKNAVPLAFKSMVLRSAEHVRCLDEYFRALYDTLRLIQEVEPFNAVAPLCAAWDLLFETQHAKESHAAIFSAPQRWALQHALLLALYPYCHAGQTRDAVAQLLIKMRRQPQRPDDIFSADVEATFSMMFSPAYDLTSSTEPGFDTAPPPPVAGHWSADWKQHYIARKDRS